MTAEHYASLPFAVDHAVCEWIPDSSPLLVGAMRQADPRFTASANPKAPLEMPTGPWRVSMCPADAQVYGQRDTSIAICHLPAMHGGVLHWDAVAHQWWRRSTTSPQAAERRSMT